MSSAWITKTKCFTTSRFLEKREFIQPFKLYGGRLFHTKVMRDEEHIYWLFDMHHIISDGTSYNIIIYDVEKAYNGGTLVPEEDFHSYN